MVRPTLPLEVGKKYMRRNGQVCRAATKHDGVVEFDAGADIRAETGFVPRCDVSRLHPHDIVADYIEPAKGHPHAALMALYAQDAAETARPWERWEAKTGDGSWVGVGRHPVWEPEQEYRRKPKTIRIGEYNVPEPMRVAPAGDVGYWTPLLGQNGPRSYAWRGDEVDQWLLTAGLVHATHEAADTHAKALVSLSAAP